MSASYIVLGSAMTDDADLVPQVLQQRSTPCLARLTAARTWDRTIALRVGTRLVGLRATRGALDTVSRLFEQLRAPEYDALVEPNFSVEFGSTGGGALDLVYRDHVIMARRRHREEILADLKTLVTASAHPEEREHLAIRASAVVMGGTAAMLLPPQWHEPLLMRQRQLTAEGLELLSPDLHLVTTDRAELVAPATTPVARLPIAVWGLRVETGHDHHLRPAQAIQLGFFNIANLGQLGPREALDSLRRMTRGPELVGLRGRKTGEHVMTARELARTASSASTGGLAADCAGELR
jgi:hypothetical protein